MVYCTVEDVLNLTRTKPKQFGFKGENAEEEFNKLIEDWILQSESHINNYCRRNWYNYINEDDGEEITVVVPPAIKNVCIRLTANIISFSFGRRDNPLKKVDDWNTGVITSTVFTDDLKEDLKAFRKPRKTHVFKI